MNVFWVSFLVGVEISWIMIFMLILKSKQEANTPGVAGWQWSMVHGLPGILRAGASTGMLEEPIGSCGIQEVFDSPHCPLCVPHLELPLGKISFSESPRAPCHLPSDLLVCQRCCPSQTISAHQSPPSKASAEISGSCIFLISLHFGALYFLSRWHFYHVFCEVHMAYKREYLFNCKTWPPVQILMSAVSIHLHVST